MFSPTHTVPSKGGGIIWVLVFFVPSLPIHWLTLSNADFLDLRLKRDHRHESNMIQNGSELRHKQPCTVRRQILQIKSIKVLTRKYDYNKDSQGKEIWVPNCQLCIIWSTRFSIATESWQDMQRKRRVHVYTGEKVFSTNYLWCEPRC